MVLPVQGHRWKGKNAPGYIRIPYSQVCKSAHDHRGGHHTSCRRCSWTTSDRTRRAEQASTHRPSWPGAEATALGRRSCWALTHTAQAGASPAKVRCCFLGPLRLRLLLIIRVIGRLYHSAAASITYLVPVRMLVSVTQFGCCQTASLRCSTLACCLADEVQAGAVASPVQKWAS